MGAFNLYDGIISLGRTKEMAKKVCLLGLLDNGLLILGAIMFRFIDKYYSFINIILLAVLVFVAYSGYYRRMKESNTDTWNDSQESNEYARISDSKHDLEADRLRIGQTEKMAKNVCTLWAVSTEIPCFIMLALKLYDNSYPTYGMIMALAIIGVAIYCTCYYPMRKANFKTWECMSGKSA